MKSISNADRRMPNPRHDWPPQNFCVRLLLPESIFLVVLFVVPLAGLLLLSFGMPNWRLANFGRIRDRAIAEGRREFGMRPGFEDGFPCVCQLDRFEIESGWHAMPVWARGKERKSRAVSNFSPANLKHGSFAHSEAGAYFMRTIGFY
ncbi:hypothetical protein [Bradyrhizobium sp. 142]|uniref:hypothetical protein n=1 Tax=Bradyrhizobium sp. 142 TaxID=2782618 RepID=UPI001FF76A90|nr:hypothetical protein [Bradyrhizobium sp. 142]MCK1727584.1 hypothetical protein [Bradyrhizobium sp. 142]